VRSLTNVLMRDAVRPMRIAAVIAPTFAFILAFGHLPVPGLSVRRSLRMAHSCALTCDHTQARNHISARFVVSVSLSHPISQNTFALTIPGSIFVPTPLPTNPFCLSSMYLKPPLFCPRSFNLLLQTS
jgi:hypothetical protein